MEHDDEKKSLLKLFEIKTNPSLFFVYFQKVYPSFRETILHTYPDVSNSDVQFLTYLKLNFCTKEIADLTYVTPKAIQMKKRRLRRKLNIPSDVDLYNWVNNFN